MTVADVFRRKTPRMISLKRKVKNDRKEASTEAWTSWWPRWWLTSLSWGPSGGVRSSWVLQRPGSCRCRSGCPERRLQSEVNRGDLYGPSADGSDFHTGGRGSPVGSSVGAPPGGSPQRSSLWVDTFWTVSQRHSRQTARSCNTCWKTWYNFQTLINPKH